MWVLYSIAAPASFLVVVLYWSVEYDGFEGVGLKDYLDIMKHGIAGFLVVLDGAVATALPVRLRHIGFFQVYCALYIVWSYVHSMLDIGNGTFRGEALYNVLNWNRSPAIAILLCAVVLLVGCPVAYFLVWALSLVSGCSLSGSRRVTLARGFGGGISDYRSMV